jgi:hypothetical protein
MPVFMMVVMVVVMMVPLSAMAVAVVFMVMVLVSVVAVAVVLVVMVLFPLMAVAVVLMVVVLFPLMAVTVMFVVLISMEMGFRHRQGTIEIGHVMVMVFVFFIQDHIEITAVDARLLDPGNFHLESFGRDGVQCLLQYLTIRSQVQERCHKHISRNAGRRFQV